MGCSLRAGLDQVVEGQASHDRDHDGGAYDCAGDDKHGPIDHNRVAYVPARLTATGSEIQPDSVSINAV